MAAISSPFFNATLSYFTNAVVYRRFDSENQNALEVHVTDLRLAFGAELIAYTAFPRHYPDSLRERGQIPSLTHIILPEDVRAAALQFCESDATMMQTVDNIVQQNLVDISTLSKEDQQAKTKDGSEWAEIYRLNATGNLELYLPGSRRTINATRVAMYTRRGLENAKEQMTRWGGSKVVLISAKDLETIVGADRTKRAAQATLTAYVIEQEAVVAAGLSQRSRSQP